MIVTIAKEFTFDAAHHLPTVPEDHKCHRMHGHTYRVELQIRGYVGKGGFCGDIDYADLNTIYDKHIQAVLDHRVLNEVFGLEVPSTENLVVWIMAELALPIAQDSNGSARLERVRVCESSSTWCEVTAMDAGFAGPLRAPA